MPRFMAATEQKQWRKRQDAKETTMHAARKFKVWWRPYLVICDSHRQAMTIVFIFLFFFASTRHLSDANH